MCMDSTNFPQSSREQILGANVFMVDARMEMLTQKLANLCVLY